MFKITKPSSTTSNFSTSLSATRPPKSDVGVIRARPSIETYDFIATISNQGNESWVTNVEVTVKTLSPIIGPELELVNKDDFFDNIGPGATKEATFQLSLTNPENPPESGDRYNVTGTIKFYQEGLEGQQTHHFDYDVDVQILE